MKKLVSECIQNAEAYPPGTPLDEVKRTYGIRDLVKLNANENCMGASPRVKKAVAEAIDEIHLYPDNSAYYLRHKLSQLCGLSPDQIMFGNGSNELVQFIIMTFLLPDEEIITAKPTFVLYGIMGRMLGARLTEVPLQDFTFDLEHMAGKITDRTKLVFISNPNNPTGTIVTGDSFRRFMEKVPDDVIVVVDEAYREYVTGSEFPDAVACVQEGKNIIVLRTFSKAYGLAGLRIGYALSSQRLIGYMEHVREPFNANALAQKAALAALEDTGHLEKTRQNNADGIDYVTAGLKNLGIDYIPSQTNFLLVRIGSNASDVNRMLLKEGIMVRSMDSYGLGEYLRVTIGLPAENRRFLDALGKVLGT